MAVAQGTLASLRKWTEDLSTWWNRNTMINTKV
jgi:hypothetical protein